MIRRTEGRPTLARANNNIHVSCVPIVDHYSPKREDEYVITCRVLFSTFLRRSEQSRETAMHCAPAIIILESLRAIGARRNSRVTIVHTAFMCLLLVSGKSERERERDSVAEQLYSRLMLLNIYIRYYYY